MINEIIEVKSPTRVDLAGGTLDLWPLYNFIGGAVTINTAIDVYTQASIRPMDGNKIILESKDLNFIKEYDSLDKALSDSDEKLSLLRLQLELWRPQGGFHLLTESQSPVGGGLGGSSSLTISLMKAFEIWTQNKKMSTHERVLMSHHIESQLLNTPTGTQDYFPADSGGLNIINYSVRGIIQKVLDIGKTPLDDHFMLIYTGKSHHSGLNNFEVLKAAVQKESRTMLALQDLKIIALKMLEAIESKNWDLIPILFNQEYEARVRLAPAFTCPEIEKLAEITLGSGAKAVKICGAGGGGCVLVWCAPAKQETVKKVCLENGFQVMSTKPVGPVSP